MNRMAQQFIQKTIVFVVAALWSAFGRSQRVQTVPVRAANSECKALLAPRGGGLQQ